MNDLFLRGDCNFAMQQFYHISYIKQKICNFVNPRKKGDYTS